MHARSFSDIINFFKDVCKPHCYTFVIESYFVCLHVCLFLCFFVFILNWLAGIKALDMDMVSDTLPSYDIYQLFFSTRDSGHGGAARDRTYVICAHQDKTSCRFDPPVLKDAISKRMHRKGQTKPSDYFMAQLVEVRQEAERLAVKRGVKYMPKRSDLSYLLTKGERKALKAYESAYREEFGREPSSDPDLVVFLGDSGVGWKTWSARSKQVPTFRRNSKTGLFWIPSLRRFMVAREKLACMAWPVTEHMSRSMCCNPIPSQDIHRAADLAGNAMHFTTVGLAQLISLSCFAPLD